MESTFVSISEQKSGITVTRKWITYLKIIDVESAEAMAINYTLSPRLTLAARRFSRPIYLAY